MWNKEESSVESPYFLWIYGLDNHREERRVNRLLELVIGYSRSWRGHDRGIVDDIVPVRVKCCDEFSRSLCSWMSERLWLIDLTLTPICVRGCNVTKVGSLANLIENSLLYVVCCGLHELKCVGVVLGIRARFVLCGIFQSFIGWDF